MNAGSWDGVISAGQAIFVAWLAPMAVAWVVLAVRRRAARRREDAEWKNFCAWVERYGEESLLAIRPLKGRVPEMKHPPVVIRPGSKRLLLWRGQ